MPEAVSINVTFGALLDGFILSLMLYGVTCCQAIQYYSYFPSDKRYIKLLVAFIWLMDTVQQALIAHALWHYLVLLRYNLSIEDASRANWSLIAQVIPTEICAVMVECFFVVRIRILDSKNRSLLLLIPMVTSFSISIVYVIKCYRLPEFTSATKMQWLPSVFGSLRAATDLAIAIMMCSILYSQYQSGLTRRTESLVRTMLQYTLTTGVLTSVLAIVYVVVYLAMPLNMIYIAVYLVHGKIYVNSMLAALNSRKSLRALAVQEDTELRPPHISLFRRHNLSSYTRGE